MSDIHVIKTEGRTINIRPGAGVGPAGPPGPPGTGGEGGVTQVALDNALLLKQDEAEKGAAGGYASLDGGTKLPIGELPAHGHSESDITGLAADLTARQLSNQKGATNGYASLDSDGLVPAAQLPSAGAIAYRNLILGQGPANYWPLGETSGDFVDLGVGNSVDFTTAQINGSPTRGAAALRSGDPDKSISGVFYINNPAATPRTAVANYTISALLKVVDFTPTGGTAYSCPIFSFSEGGPALLNREFVVLPFGGTVGALSLVADQQAGAIAHGISANLIQQGLVYHVAATAKADGTIKFFVNGVKYSDTTLHNTNPVTTGTVDDFLIGWDWGTAGGSPVSKTLQHVAYFERVLGDSEIMAQATGAVVGVNLLDDLGDVNLASVPTNGQALVFNTATSEWAPGSVVGGVVPTTTATTNYTLLITDKRVEMNSASARTITVPPNASVAFPIGSEIRLSRYGTGGLAIVAGSGVTIRSTNGALALLSQYSEAMLTKRATNEWMLVGDIA